MMDELDDEVQDLLDAQRASLRYMRSLARHPDCRDPEHPGCPNCQDEETEND